MLRLPNNSMFGAKFQIRERTVSVSQFKWSVLHDFPARKMYETVQNSVFHFCKGLHGDKGSAYVKYMDDAIFKPLTPLMLDEVLKNR